MISKHKHLAIVLTSLVSTFLEKENKQLQEVIYLFMAGFCEV